MAKSSPGDNNVDIGEISRYQQFLLFPPVFSRLLLQTRKNQGLFGRGLRALTNPFPNKPWFLLVCSTSLENTVGKGEIARYEQFLLCPQCFLPVCRTFCHFHQI